MTSSAAQVSPDAQPAGAEKLAMQVARRIEDEIVDRGWPVGQVLGSETELRERFGVSRSVLREAIRLVEHHQVGQMRRGPNGGLVVCAPDAGPATRALVMYLEYVGTSIEDLLATRLLLEPLAARLTAGALTEDGIDRLRAALGTEAGEIEQPGVGTHDHLHVLLAELSGNAVLHLFVDVLVRLTDRYARTSRRTTRAATVAAKSGSHDSHVRILDAVTAGDAAGAETRLLTHLTEMEGWLREHRVDQPAAQLPVRPTRPVGDHPKLGEVVADRIHHDIAVHGWPVGEVLGSETGLLQRYGVSRAVLREAVRLLEHHGVARMRRGPGGGLVIGAPDPTASIHTMALYLDHQAVGADDLRTVREAIELGCIRAVTAARPADAEERLRAAIDLAVEDGGSRDLFHTELAELAANPVLILFLQIITDLWGRHSESRRPLAPALTDEVRWIHQRILDAVRSGDEGLAQHRMRRHLQALTAWWH